LSIIVTIDGPAGSGKSSVSKKLAEKLKFIHLNSGLMYRVIARAAIDRGLDLNDIEGLSALAEAAGFDFNLDSSDFRTRVEVIFSDDASYRIPEESVYDEQSSQGASRIAMYPAVREVLSRKQREVGTNSSLVLEGRDAGTVVFPDADFKFYLETSLDERVWRRLSQLTGRERSDPEVRERFEEGKAKILERDKRDMSRDASPLRIPEGAEVIHTDALSEQEVVSELFSRVMKKVSADEVLQ
jgi:CMP/dCMP kinase